MLKYRLYGGKIMFNILVVEDNADLREMFCQALNDNGYRSYGAADGKLALDVTDKVVVDLIIADIMMPNIDGYELTRLIRDSGNNVPILVITAKDDYESMNKSFTVGADDYMIKPVNIKEMLLRVGALLRRARINAEKRIVIGSTELDFETMQVKCGGEEITLPLKEFNLLFKLLSSPNKIFTRRQIMDDVWGMESDTDDRTLNTHVNRLRERFENNSDFEIVTIRGLGYKAVKK